MKAVWQKLVYFKLLERNSMEVRVSNKNVKSNTAIHNLKFITYKKLYKIKKWKLY